MSASKESKLKVLRRLHELFGEDAKTLGPIMAVAKQLDDHEFDVYAGFSDDALSETLKALAGAAGARSSAVLTKEDVHQACEAACEAALEKNKQSTIAISEFGTEQWSYLSQAAGLTMHTANVSDSERTTLSTIGAFSWDDRVEPAQADRYMPYLQQIIKMGGRTTYPLVWLAGGSSNKTLLDTHGLQSVLHYHKIVGNTDAAIVSRAANDVGLPRDGLCVLFKLKKKISAKYVYQAACQAVLAGLGSQFKPIVVLSDLDDDWRLFWLDNKTVWAGKLASRGAAQAIIQGCVDAAVAEASGSSSKVTLPPVLANRQPAAFLKAADAAVGSLDAPLWDVLDQLPVAEARQLHAQLLLNQLSLQPSFCGLASTGENPLVS